MAEILGIGAAHMDRRGRCEARYRPGASNPGAMREAVGGAAFNALRAARLLDVQGRLISARGGDANGVAVGEALRDAGIDDMAVTWLDRRTPTYTALLDHDGDLVGGLADMALYELMQPRVFKRRHIRQALSEAALLLLDANLPEASIARLVADTPAPAFAIAVSPAKVHRLAGVLGALETVFLSRAEATELLQVEASEPLPNVVARLSGAGCRSAVVTDGPRAAAILDQGTVGWQVPPAIGPLQDVTGAGDTLAGTTVAALASGIPFAEAARLGVAAASLHISSERRSGDFTWDFLRGIAARMSPPTAERLATPSETP